MNTIQQLAEQIGTTVTLAGWVANSRSSGKIAFVQFRDGTGFVQVVFEQSVLSEEQWQCVTHLEQESSIRITGQVVKDDRSPTGVEVQGTAIEVIAGSPEYPISNKEHGPDFLMDHRHLWIRSKKQWAILRIRNEVFHSIEAFLRREGFVRTDTPIFQPTSCEDTTELYEVDHFGTPAYLTQSGQLYLEALEFGLGRVYDFGPVFRAEKSKTRKHLNEFWMMDWEAVFHDQQDAETLLEQMLKSVLKHVLERCKTELQILERDTTLLQRAVDEPFPRVKLRDIIRQLNEEHGFTLGLEDDLNTEAEEKIGEIYGVPVLVEDYPFAVKAFYMKRYKDEDGIERGYCADLIAPEGAGEIGTAAVREERYEPLLESLKERGYPVEDYQWYLDMRRYGSVPHAGGGIGAERWVRWITGAQHIRETIPFPRTMTRLKP